MKLHFLGAAQEVTGSCYLLEINGKKLLVDCGLLQGDPKSERRNAEPFPFTASDIDAVVLTHAHIDHSGRLPLLAKAGFKGPIYTHQASAELCRIMLADSAYLQEKDSEWDNRKRERKGLKPIEPLYTRADAENTQRQFHGLAYGEAQEILPGITLQLHDAGHILGSAIVELQCVEKNIQRRLVFSGDLGHAGMPILRDPTFLPHADLVVMESTYGDRLHRTWQATWEEVKDVVANVQDSKGNILIPSFAVGRTQELLYMFGKYFNDWGLDRWQIFLDSPLAIEATEIYTRFTELFDPDAVILMKKLRDNTLLPNYHVTPDMAQSLQLNQIRSGAIIIAGSGMCNGGRIKQHLKHHIWRAETHVVIVGYQAEGTLGRALVDGAKHIRLWGETVRVAATIHTIGGLSAHADQAGLLRWYSHFKNAPPVVLTHGEPAAINVLKDCLQQRGPSPVWVPNLGDQMDLVKMRMEEAR